VFSYSERIKNNIKFMEEHYEEDYQYRIGNRADRFPGNAGWLRQEG
jgi:hypothetical protein